MRKTFWKFIISDVASVTVILAVLAMGLIGFAEEEFWLKFGWVTFFFIIEVITFYKLHQKWKKLYKSK